MLFRSDLWAAIALGIIGGLANLGLRRAPAAKAA